MRRALRHVLAVDQDPPRGRRDEPGDEVERGRLAAAGRAQEGQELALVHGEVESVDRAHRAVVARAAPELHDDASSMPQEHATEVRYRSASHTTRKVATMKSEDSAAMVGSV